MNLNINKIQIQKQIFSPSLEQSLNVLLLPYAELSINIEQELQNNPLLEAETITETMQDSSIDWQRLEAIANLPSNKNNYSNIEENQEAEYSSMASMMTLEDHLFQQLFWEISDPFKRKIGEFIIGNLDKDGYLSLDYEEIAKCLNISGTSEIREVLDTIQNFDPLGIATKNFKESLIVQLFNRQSPYRDLSITIVESYLDDLGHKRYASLAKKLSVSIEAITEAAHLISQLEPKPAQNYRPLDPSIYIQPDIYIRKDDSGEYIIETNKKGLPILRINQMYQNLLKNQKLSTQERDFIKEKLNNALNFIKSIQQRGDTLSAITRYILKHQIKFFEGEESIAPLAFKDVAIFLDRNESTISRAISNKYVDTPQGLFPLKFFFSHTVARQNNEDVSAHNVKEELSMLIEEENKKSPLSDQDIQSHFDAKGIHLARRTISKYRKMLNIPSSYLRKSNGVLTN